MAILKKQSTSSDRNLFYRGELSETTVASLLLDALEERLSGTLTLIRGTVRKVIHLHHGRPVYARSSLRSETLGQMLVNKGLIQPEQHSAALEHSRQQKVPYSEVLFEQGVMKQERIQQEMTENVRQRIETCLHWRSGSWMFIGDEEVVSKVPHCPLETRDLVMDGFDTASGEDEDLEPGEELEEPFMDDEPTPIVDPPEPDKALFDDEPTPLVDSPEPNKALFEDEPTPIVDLPQQDQAPPAEGQDQDTKNYSDQPTKPGQHRVAHSAGQGAPRVPQKVEPEAAPRAVELEPGPRPTPPARAETGPAPPVSGSARSRHSDPLPRRRPGWLVLLLSYLLGVTSASAFFLLYGSGPTAGDHKPATPATGQDRPERAADARTPAAEVKGAPAARDRVSAAASAGPRADSSAAGRADSKAASPGQSTAITAGLVVAAAMRQCLSTSSTRTYLISVRISAGGRVNRVFMARRPRLSGAARRCIKQTLRGTTLPLRLRDDGYMEWRIGLGTDPPTVELRPAYLRKVVEATR